jgi:C4-dicarboxylate-specific signal transduction histidine kinase
LDLNHVLFGARNLNNLGLRKKTGIEIEMAVHPTLPRVRGDGNQILQLFFNLVTNAADAPAQVGAAKLLIWTLLKDSKLLVEFANTDPGIQSPHPAFDPFFTAKRLGNGTGFGLSIFYGIVQEHGRVITCFKPSGRLCGACCQTAHDQWNEGLTGPLLRIGGRQGIRTPDPRVANAMLSQLS